MTDLKLNYPYFTGRRYVFAIKDNPDNTPMISAEAAFMADVFITHPGNLRKQFADSLEYQKQEKSYIPLIGLDKRYGVYPGEKRGDGTLQRRYRKLTELTPHELLFAILEKMRIKAGAKNLYYKTGEEIFEIKERERTGYEPHIGGIVLSAYERPKSDARRKTKALRKVEIEGPFETSKIPFNNIHSESEDFFYSLAKQGYTKGQLLSTDVQALLLYAKRNPHRIRNFRNLLRKHPKLAIFTPIHTKESQTDVLEKYPVWVDYFMEKGEQPELTRLRDDILFDWLFNGRNFFEIGKDITKIPTIADMKLADKIYNGTADIEVIINKYLFRGNAFFVPQAVKGFFFRMHNYLKNEGFEPDGYCLEKRDSENETIAMVYKKGDESARLLFNPNFPPVIIKRKEDPKFEVTPFRVEEKNNKVHPYSELFMPKEVFDDKRRRRTHYEAVIPTEFDIPRELWQDYKTTIDKHFSQGNEGLERLVRMMKVPNQSRILNLTRLS